VAAVRASSAGGRESCRSHDAGATIAEDLLKPVRLEGPTVALKPLSNDHHAALCGAVLDPTLWQWTLHRLDTPDDVSRYIATALGDAAAGTVLPFVIVLKETGEVVGSTRYHSIEPAERRLEIGHTWITKRWQRTQVNTETKYLLLRYAFEDLRCRRVQFRAAGNNEASQRALLRIGAHQEGVLREYVGADLENGRDVAVFSILVSEWPTVKASLETMMRRTDGQ
jgi:RimJ/RimL family protein N-acetyltransferase